MIWILCKKSKNTSLKIIEKITKSTMKNKPLLMSYEVSICYRHPPSRTNIKHDETIAETMRIYTDDDGTLKHAHIDTCATHMTQNTLVYTW